MIDFMSQNHSIIQFFEQMKILTIIIGIIRLKTYKPIHNRAVNYVSRGILFAAFILLGIYHATLITVSYDLQNWNISLSILEFDKLQIENVGLEK